MKTFIVINGKEAYIIERVSMEKAIESALNISNHSKEILVREITELTDYTFVYTNQEV